MIAEFDLEIKSRKPDRQEMLNLRNKDCQEVFKNLTEENEELLNCFEHDLNIDVQSKLWKRTFNSVLCKSFCKVRIVNNNKKGNDKMKTLINESIDEA